MWEKFLLLILQEHRGKVLGILIGLVAAILIVSYGLLKALFIMICIGLGYFIGKKIDEKQDWDEWLKEVFRQRE
ncbi:Uncharacterized membrane protein [Thermosyntropha lipolytica DSM 11003]|uniref:Uncharacterized membrane protein n=1 Tax=Thermosyntropha lipolytica DSM 11003 TaxID=1123382 RepID=A0A1M5LIZ9_9FIRM|nr:DUF2273 domain-containing protein [Thermosyntropha lipolytica]SHG65017.1 Uncharacterized membrane protein [Thermosyntropha lipolytica DSM 11003]